MSLLVSTSVQSEGSDPLKELFDTNNRLQIDWYNKLVEEDITYDDLITSSETDLRTLLKDCEFKTKQIIRIINSVREISGSTIHKALNSVKVSVISTEENVAISNIKQKSERINKVIRNITNTMCQLNKNTQLCEATINDNCDAIIKAANKRRNELLSKLKKVANTKVNKLLNQQNVFTKEKSKLDEYYNKSQVMIKD
eukprot:527118_1